MLALLTCLLAGPFAMQDIHVQTVVATIAETALENAELPESERVTGDALADLYIRRACGTAQPAKAIVLGLAYALEPTGIIAANPLARSSLENVESSANRERRLAAMGTSTLRGRADWLSHFVVSAGVAVTTDAVASELVGIQKEVADAIGRERGSGSGFSFTDLNADLAGIAFAKWLTGSKAAVAAAAMTFAGSRFLPDPAGLPDSLSWTEFETAWGGTDDPRFQSECARLRQRAGACEAYGTADAWPVDVADPPDVSPRPTGCTLPDPAQRVAWRAGQESAA